jgi:hypothetical protein
MKTLNSEDLREYVGASMADVLKEDVSVSSDLSANDTSQERLGKIMHTENFVPVSRSKHSRTIPHINISKS